MELLAYIQEEFTDADDAAIVSEIPETFQAWFKNSTTKSAKLSLSVLLTGTTLMIGLGSTLTALAAQAPSSDTKYTQSLLAKNGFDPGAIDGVSGVSTKNAILRAQKNFGLTPDGVVGSRTIAALEDGKSADAIAEKVDIAGTTTVAAGEAATTVSSTVMNLQKLLADRGFYNGAVDGIMGNQTRMAIVTAQKAYNLTPDGVAGSQTLAALESDGGKATATPISNTSTTKSAEVSNLQDLLSKRGFYNGAVDGIMGNRTREAIVAAQKNYGLATDGVAGSQTIAALESGVSTVSKTSESASSIKDANTKSDKDVVALQQLLAKRGFYNGAIDGFKGAQTTTAIASAQKTYGLATDGIAGAQTIAALQTDVKPLAAAAPTPVASNQAAKTVNTANDGGVANLQILLTDRGFYNGPITGFLGTRTTEAIKTAQKAYSLTADGVAGARTIAALELGAPKQQISVTNVTPTVRVEPKPQVAPTAPQITPQPKLQPQIRVQPQAKAAPPVVPQPTIQAKAKPQVQPITAATPNPKTAAVTPAPVATPAPVKTSVPTTTSNSQVSELQRLLIQRGFYNGKADGVLSGETRNAIIRAQNFYTVSPADGSPSNKLVDILSKDTFISEGN